MIEISGNEDATVVEDGIENTDISSFIDTGVYALNALLSGSIFRGIANNKIVALAGSESVGKTFFAMNIVKSFLDSNPESICVYFDSENAITKDMFANRGIDTKRVASIPVITIEEFRNQTIKMVDNYLSLDKKDRKPMLIVLDSLGMTSTSKEIRDTEEGKDTKDMTRAQIIKATFRVLTIKLGKAGIPLIMTNHTYEKLGSLYPEKEMGGGSGLKYSASTILYLSKRKEKVDNEVIGNVIHCKLIKSRFTKENKMIDSLLTYDKGLNKYYGLIPLAEKYGIFKKVSTRYEMPDGSKVFEKAINDEPEKYFTPEVLKKLDEAAGKEFRYGNEIPPEVKE